MVADSVDPVGNNKLEGGARYWQQANIVKKWQRPSESDPKKSFV